MDTRIKKLGLSLAMVSALALAGCGDVNSPPPDTTTGTTTGGTTTGGTTTGGTTTPTVTYTMTLTSDLTTVPAGGTATITATVLANGAPDLTLTPTVNFTSTCVAKTKATLDSSVTGAASIAVSNYTDKGCGGADTIVASATVDGQNISKTLSITVEALSITLTAPATLTAGGTTPIVVKIYSGGALLTSESVPVTFTSTCAGTNTASLTSPVSSINGVATSTYTDKGCAMTDTITASVAVGALTKSAIAQMTVETLGVQVTSSVPQLPAGTKTTINAAVTSGGKPYTAAQVPVTFTSICVAGNKATMVNSVLTNKTTGIATVDLTDDGCGITTDTIVASAKVGQLTASGEISLLVEGFTLTVVPTINPLAGGASTSVKATVSNSLGTYTDKPAEVAFTSNCVTQKTATMTTPAFTSAGAALSTYTDQGCGTKDTLLATAKLGAATFTATAALDVQQVVMSLTTAATTLAAGGTTQITATITSGGAAPATPVAVTFTSTCVSGNKATMASSAFTDASGNATVDFIDRGCGPTTDAISATAYVGGVLLTKGTNLLIKPFTMTLSPDPTVITDPAVDLLSAGATMPVTATIYSDTGIKYTQSVPVAFTSTCAAAAIPKATLDSPVYANNGDAISSYTDKGCASTDTVNASATVGGITVTANTSFKVASPAAGSIVFVSATPTNIGLQGSGLGETSTVKFQVLDGSGNGLGGQPVTFSLDNTLGGVSLPATTTVTTDSSGFATTTVSSGTAATTVRVKAVSGVLSSQSTGIVISTGIPDQDSFSLSTTTFNPEAFTYDGNKVDINVYAADAFNNPVPDGSAIYFTTEGGQIESSCVTAGGGCKVVWTSANPRPANGRITILATMTGEESFTDQNSNNRYDSGEPLVDVPEAWLDADESGSYTAGEQYNDFNNNGVYDNVDGAYSGVLCNSNCAASKSVEVRGDIVMMMAESDLVFSFDSLTYTAPTSGVAAVCGAQTNGYPPVGTKITVAGNGKATLTSLDTVPNAIPPMTPPPGFAYPGYEHCFFVSFSIDSDGTSSTGALTFTAEAPISKKKSSASVSVTD